MHLISLLDLSCPLFKTVKKGRGYSKANLGYNFLSKNSTEVAQVLNFDDPERFTGHSFRRSLTTHAADEGAPSVEMRRY